VDATRGLNQPWVDILSANLVREKFKTKKGQRLLFLCTGGDSNPGPPRRLEDTDRLGTQPMFPQFILHLIGVKLNLARTEISGSNATESVMRGRFVCDWPTSYGPDTHRISHLF